MVSLASPTAFRYPRDARRPGAPWVAREASPPGPPRPHLLARVRDALRARHYGRSATWRTDEW